MCGAGGVVGVYGSLGSVGVSGSRGAVGVYGSGGSVGVNGVSCVVSAKTPILRVCVSDPAVFVALTVKEKVPTDVGVPEITPVLLRLNPSGSLPSSSVQDIGVVFPFANPCPPT